MHSHKSSGKYEDESFGAIIVFGRLDLDAAAAIVRE